MNYCSKHMDRDALSFCHNCGKYFCKDCLIEGKEYYYCTSPECQKQLQIEIGDDAPVIRPEEMPEKEFIKFFAEMNKMDAAVFQSLLDDAQIDYYTSSGTFFDAPVEFYICADHMPEVEEILKNFTISNIYYSTKNDLTE